MTNAYLERRHESGCAYCRNEPEPGWIEMDNNGPIVRCPVCERASLRAKGAGE